MAQVRGTVDTIGILQGRRDFDWSGIYMRYVNQFPLPLLLNKLAKEKATNSKFDHFEDELLPDTVQVNGALPLTSEVTLTLDDATSLVAGDVLHNPLTRENLLVVAYLGTTSVTISRGLGTTTPAAIADDQVLFNIGPTFTEGASLADPVTTKTEQKSNYCQIFKRTISLSKTLQASTLYGGPEEALETKKQEMVFLRNMNYAFQFGYRHHASTDANLRQTGGLLEWVTTNVTNVGATTLTQAAFETFLQSCFEYTTDTASNSKVLIASPLLAKIISGFGNAKLNIPTQGEAQTFGLNVTTYISALGPRVNVVTDWLLKGATYGAWGWLIDLNSIKYKYLREVQMRRNVQNPGDDAIKHEIIAEVGIKIINEKSHGIIRNFTS